LIYSFKSCANRSLDLVIVVSFLLLIKKKYHHAKIKSFSILKIKFSVKIRKIKIQFLSNHQIIQGQMSYRKSGPYSDNTSMDDGMSFYCELSRKKLF